MSGLGDLIIYPPRGLHIQKRNGHHKTRAQTEANAGSSERRAKNEGDKDKTGNLYTRYLPSTVSPSKTTGDKS